MSENETPLPYVVQRQVEMERITINHAMDTVLAVTWGEARILFHADGRLTVEGCPTMDAAAMAFWKAVAKWAPAGMQVLLPEGYGEDV